MISVLGLIPARGGSRSIPGKNIKALHGRPLIAYTIAEALHSKLTRTILSTEDEQIAAIGKSLGVEVPFLRPADLARDDAGSIDVALHALDRLKENEGVEYDYLMILQPTSPFRRAADIDACIELAAEKNADSVMSMVEVEDFSPLKLKTIDAEGLIRPLFEEEGPISRRRQDAPTVYKRNAAIYLTRTRLIKNRDLFGERSYAYIMPRERSLDINSPFDFRLAEYLMAGQKA